MGLVGANFGPRSPKNGQNNDFKIVDFMMLMCNVHAAENPNVRSEFTLMLLMIIDDSND